MPNWSTNHTIFVGPKVALDDINHAITDAHEFDFNQINPTPTIFGELATPTYDIPDAEFAKKHNLDKAPTTVDELLAFINTQPLPYALHIVPKTVLREIIDTYGNTSWYDWRTYNWGTKWVGNNAKAQRFHDNLLIITYDTAWSPPVGIFSYLRANYEGLHIINGADIEGVSDGIEPTEGGLTSFHTYFTTHSSVGVESYDFSHLPGFANASDEAKQGVELWYNEQCEINTANIDTLIEHGYLVGEEGEIIRIADIEGAL